MPHPSGPANASAAAPTRGGGLVSKAPGGGATYRSRDNGTTAHVQNGRVTHVERAGTVIRHPAGGARTVEVRRPGNRVVVVHGGGRGYVERPIRVGRRAYVQRTYYVNRVAYVRAYRHVFYHGIALNFYAPMRYYPVGFYGWAGAPWGPVGYAWGWTGDPWFGYYGAYYHPWGVYPSPSFWLTDYLISTTLQSAFQARQDALAAQAAESADAAPDQDESAQAGAPMSDDVKQLVEEEVRRQLAEAQAEAGEQKEPKDAVPPSLNENGQHLFVAGDDVEVRNTATGQTCFVGQGDAIQMNGGLPTSGEVNVLVRASKGSSCPVNSTVSIALPDLIEMHNNMRDTIDRGLEALRTGQGANNLPLLPPDVAGEPRPTAFAASLQADPDAAQVIGEAGSQADQIEREVVADFRNEAPDAAQTTAASTTPPPAINEREAGMMASIQSGQTEEQVIAVLGQPLRTSFLGGVKKQYEYASGRITFTDGEVSDVTMAAAGTAGAVRSETNPARMQPQKSAGAAAVVSNGLVSNGLVSNGLSESEVVALLGQPLRVSFMGGLKKVYEYGDRKIVFTDGAVSEVQ